MKDSIYHPDHNNNFKRNYWFYKIYEKTDPEKKPIYIGQTYQSLQERFDQHTSFSLKGRNYRQGLYKGQSFYSRKDELEIEAILPDQLNLYPYEADVLELHLIQKYGKQFELQNDFDTPPIGKNKFDFFKDGYGYNPCG